MKKYFLLILLLACFYLESDAAIKRDSQIKGSTIISAPINEQAPTFPTSVTSGEFISTAPDGKHYVRPYNSVPFSDIALIGMIQTTPSGPIWFNGTSWVSMGSGAISSVFGRTGVITPQSGDYSVSQVTGAASITYVDTAISGIAAGSIPHVSSGAPISPGTWNYNTTDNKLRTRKANGDVFVTSAMTLESSADTTPAAFTFTDVTDATLSTLYTSNAITVTGIDWPTTITVTGGEYEKNTSGTWTSEAGTVVLNDTIKVRHTSSTNPSTAVNTSLTIGGVSDTYTTTTAAASGDSQIIFYYNADTKGSAVAPQKGSGTVDSSALSVTTGVVGNAIQTTDSWQTANIPTLNNISLDSTWTIGFYYKYNAGMVGTVFSRNEGEGTSPYLYLTTASSPSFTFAYLDSYNNMNFSISPDTWHFVEVSGDNTTGKGAYRIDGGAWTERTGLTGGAVATTYIVFGNNNGASAISYYDQIIFANTYKKDLYAVRNNTSF